MTVAGQTQDTLDKPSRFSFWFIAGVLVVAACLHLGWPLVVILFSFFALTKLNFLPKRGRWAAVGLFLFLSATLAYGLGLFVNQMVRALPEIADRAIPAVIEWAKKYQMDLPFTDFDSLKETAMDTIKSQVHYLNSFAQVARGAASEVILCVVGVVIAIALFCNRGFEPMGRPAPAGDNVYTAYTDAIAARFRTFYESFATVMGAQLIISAINTTLTAIFVLLMHIPHALLVIGATFLCGLLPIVGNLLSNTIIVGVGITVSPKVAIICLIFLIVVHKLEYFLNGKIVGDRIRNPFWLTLLGLIIGEKLMGIPGMILAPVVLNYIKVEASRLKQPKLEG
jgi:predicted PurR-regulated permease PerM